MSTRDELANLIDDAIEWAGQEDIALAEHVTDAILAAGYSRPRVVETIEQLVALPDGTAIHNANGTLGELSTVGGVRVAFWAGNECEDELIEPWIGLPATVLYLPEETS